MLKVSKTYCSSVQMTVLGDAILVLRSHSGGGDLHNHQRLWMEVSVLGPTRATRTTAEKRVDWPVVASHSYSKPSMQVPQCHLPASSWRGGVYREAKILGGSD